MILFIINDLAVVNSRVPYGDKSIKLAKIWELMESTTNFRFENELSKVVADMVAPLRELLQKAEVGTDSVERVGEFEQLLFSQKCLFCRLSSRHYYQVIFLSYQHYSHASCSCLAFYHLCRT